MKTGKDLIRSIVAELKSEGKPPHDYMILNKIRELKSDELYNWINSNKL